MSEDTQETGSVETAPVFEPPIQELLDCFLKAAKDADICLKDGNKSAGRRARGMLGDIKKRTTPLRKAILERMKGKSKEEVDTLYKQFLEEMASKKKKKQ